LRKITLTYIGSRKPIVAKMITPDYLWNLSQREIEEIHLRKGNRLIPLKQFFRVDAEEYAPNHSLNSLSLEIENSDKTLKWVGSRMSGGILTINGDVGEHLGSQITGGKIIVNGDVGNWCAAEMKNGEIIVNGSVGDFVGSNYIGSKHGMTGGQILVNGNAGDFVGARLLNGIILIEGDAGMFLGYYMRGGKIIVKGKCSEMFGARMKGGIIELHSSPHKITIGLVTREKAEPLEISVDKGDLILEGDKSENGKGIVIIKSKNKKQGPNN